MRISDWSSDVCSSDLRHACRARHGRHLQHPCGDAAVARRAPDDLDDDDCVASWVCLPGCTDAPGTSGEIDQCSITSVPIWRWPSTAAVEAIPQQRQTPTPGKTWNRTTAQSEARSGRTKE